MNLTPREEVVPITPQTFHILLALAEKPMYGYGIVQQCQADAGGNIEFESTNVYRGLRKLEAVGYIQVVREDYGRGSHHPRRFYALTQSA